MKIADKSVRNLSILALGIGVGILLQVAPLNLIGFNRPLWSAVAVAIGDSTAGYITVDRRETIITLAKYLVLMGTVVTVSLACADQRRSTQMLSGLAWLLSIFAGACLLKILLNVVRDFDGKARLLADWTHVSVLGILLVGAMVIRKIPIGQFRLNALVPRAWPELSRGFVSGILIIALFSVPLFARGSQAYAIPVVCGISSLVVVLIVERTTSGMSGTLFTIVLMLCALWLAGVAFGIIGSGSSVTWMNASETDIATAEGIFRDFRWSGSGAGTYSLLVPVYVGSVNGGGEGLFDAPPPVLMLPVELGIPLALLTVVGALVMAWTLISRIVRSGCNYFQPMLAFSVLVYVMGGGFASGPAMSFSTMIIAAAMIGLGLTQTQDIAHSPLNNAGPLRIPQNHASDSGLEI